MGANRGWLRVLMGIGAVMMVLSITIAADAPATAEHEDCNTHTPTTVPTHPITAVATLTNTPTSDQAGGIAPSNSVRAFQQNTPLPTATPTNTPTNTPVPATAT